MTSIVGGAGVFAVRTTFTAFLAGVFSAAFFAGAFFATFRVGAFAAARDAAFLAGDCFATLRAGGFATFTGAAFLGVAFFAATGFGFATIAFFAARLFVAADVAFLPAGSLRLGFEGPGVAFDGCFAGRFFGVSKDACTASFWRWLSHRWSSGGPAEGML